MLLHQTNLVSSCALATKLADPFVCWLEPASDVPVAAAPPRGVLCQQRVGEPPQLCVSPCECVGARLHDQLPYGSGAAQVIQRYAAVTASGRKHI
jgi:hypothetical protein